MQFGEWKENLLCSLFDCLKNDSFVRRSKDQAFDKQCGSVRLAFHLCFIRHTADFDVTADVAIRFDDVEDLINSFNAELSPRKKKGTFTMGCELGNLTEGEQRRWSVTRPEDIPAVAKSLYSAFQIVALPYYEKYSDRDTALNVLSGDTPESWLHCPFHTARAERAVSMALLMKGKEEARKLAEAKLDYLQGRKDPNLWSFQDLIASLDLA